MGFSTETCKRVIKEDLKNFPYIIQAEQKHTAADKTKKKALTEIMLEKMENKTNIMNLLGTSDEVHFHLEIKVYSMNNVFWLTEKKKKTLR